MRQLLALGLFAIAVSVSGCIDSQFIKSISVEKDENGKVVKVTETETAVQRGEGWPIKFENLKGIQSASENGSGQSAPKFPKSK